MSRMKNAPLSALYIGILSAVLAGCMTEGSSGGQPPAGSEEAFTPIAYTVVGDAIINHAHTETDRYCDGEILKSETYQTPADTVRFTITGKLLTVHPSVETLSSGAVVQWTSSYTRVGSGSGLGGDWTQNDQTYQVLSGEPDSLEKDGLEERAALTRRMLTYTIVTVRFADGKISAYQNGDLSRRFIDNWNTSFGEDTDLPDSAIYDIDVKALDRKTVELKGLKKGLKTGETVRIAMRVNGDRTYTSNVPGHAEFRYTDTPTACPEVFYPNWFLEFEQANASGPLVREKAAAPRAKKGIRFPADF